MSSFADRPRGAIAALLLCFASVEFLFRAPLLLGAVALYQRDLLLLYFPLVQAALRALSEGALPLRDATSAFGQPLLADPSCQILYPPVGLYLLLPPHVAYAWLVSLHSVFGALGVALLARNFSGGSWLSAVVGGLSWLLSGPLQSMATLWHHMSGAAWIPWVLLCVLRAARGEPRAALHLGGAFGLQILAGSADMCAMTVLVSALFVPPGRILRAWRTWLTAGLLALALSAGVWLPAAELVMNSARSALPQITRTFWSLHPVSALEFFLPVPLSALPLRPEWREALFDGREPFLGSMFMGVLIMPLSLGAFADAQISRRLRLACFLGAIGGFLVALGKNGVAYEVAVALLPPLKILRFPSKAMIPVCVLLSVLAGAGAASIRRSLRSRRFAGVGAGFLAACAGAGMGPLSGPFFAFLLDSRQDQAMQTVWQILPEDLLFSLVLLVVFTALLRWPRRPVAFLLGATLLAGQGLQSARLHLDLNPTVPSTILGYKPPYLDSLRPPPTGRIYVYDYQLFEGRAKMYLGDAFGKLQGVEGLSAGAANVLATRAYLAPLTGAFWGIEYAWDADVRMLFDRRLAALTTGLRRAEGTEGLLKLLQISGVPRVVALHEARLNGLELLLRQKIFFPEELRLFVVPDVLPRAHLTSGRRQGHGSDLKDLLDGSFDHRTTVLTDVGPVREPVPDFVGHAMILERRSDRLIVETRATHPGFLSVIESAMPGWRAWIDGRSVQVERANAAFIGVEVPVGTHRVELRFLPTTVVVGAVGSAVTAVSLLFFLIRGSRSTEAE